jgi:hypothetical protein
MPDRQEVFASLYGAYRLARLDPWGMAHFNLTVEGFWRSFFAAVLVAPGYAILIANTMATRPETFHFGRVLLVQSVAYLLSWAAFPVAALIITYWLQLTRNYVPLIVASNWAAVIQIALFLAAFLLTRILPGPLAGLLLTVVTVSILAYEWFVMRTALETTGGIALALVLVDLILNFVINASAEQLL